MPYNKKIRRERQNFFLLISLFLFILVISNGFFGGKIRMFFQEKKIVFLEKIFFRFNKRARVNEGFSIQEENLILKRKLKEIQEKYSVLNSFCSFEQSFLNCTKETVFSAQVIYRDPSFWNSSLWINLGQATCPNLKKNSPVISGQFLVGLVDFVGEHQSRVRLITDVGLNPSVYIPCSQTKDSLIKTVSNFLLGYLRDFHGLENKALIDHLEKFCSCSVDRNVTSSQPRFFGILRGTGNPLWSKHSAILKGYGFCKNGFAKDHTLNKGDLLATTGFDGIFPEGLPVAQITEVRSPKEGDYTLEFSAVPLITDFDSLREVLVLSPRNFDFEDFPDILGLSIK